ncbi:Imm1 family immunity protein [Kutzneria sp. NPDC051319]|uniref:Imm1 family immunity protein n=1 Tax=Kutzneria sp. NPDC051319 TaxID=3155047 RepID=UPI00341B0993
MDIQVMGHVGRRYVDRGEQVVHDPSPAVITNLLAELCAVDEDPEWWNDGVIGKVGAVDGVGFVVAPVTGYVALSWTGTAERSLNPKPFDDAPLLPRDGADDPLVYYPRSAYLPAEEAKKALAEHIVTGAQPTCVQWQPWGWEVRELPVWLTPEMPEYPAFHLISD